MVTSADRQKLFSKQCLSATPWLAQRSSIKHSKASLCMPETPSEPVSSLSARMHTAVRSGVPRSNRARSSA